MGKKAYFSRTHVSLKRIWCHCNLYWSQQPGFYHRLESFSVWIADTTEKIFQI